MADAGRDSNAEQHSNAIASESGANPSDSSMTSEELRRVVFGSTDAPASLLSQSQGSAVPTDHPLAAHQSTTSPSDAASSARGPEDLLRRMSLTVQSSEPAEVAKYDPRSAPESLHLTGRVISAAFCLPYKIDYAPGAEWDVTPRHGTSALFDALAYLSSPESGWEHTLVGWTGEIDRAFKRHDAPFTNRDGTMTDTVPISRPSAPLPAQPERRPTQTERRPTQSDHSELKIPSDDRAQLLKSLEQLHGGRIVPVWLPDDIEPNDTMTFRNQKKWRRYGEHELFTLFHYKQNEPSDGRAIRKAWADYYRMNKAFADAIMEVYKPGDVVIVHDYHLALLPGLLRQRAPNIYLGFFLHVPFPSSEYYRCLTRRKEVLEGMLGANMVGFQAFSYSRHFSSCCTRILGFDSNPAGVDAYGAHVAVDIFPIGINTQVTIDNAFATAGIQEKMLALRDVYADRKVIVGRDRLDSIRGVVQKLQAFEMFLDRYPEWREKVVLIQVTSPTSIEDRSEKGDKTEVKISEMVGRINSKYGSLSYTPVQHFPQYLSKEEYFALLRIADLGLITSVRDGMNTTALEYVVCQRDNHAPLIISEFSGTAGSLGDAIHINPWDLGGTADAIEQALTMSEEQKEAAHKKLYSYVTRNTVQAWMSSFVKRLVANLASYDQSAATPVLDRSALLQQYRASTRRLFMFDYDGTLTPIVRDPQLAIPSDRVIRTLKTLASDSRNAVWIISGRDQAFLDEWMGHIPELGLSAEHGSFIRMPNSTSNWENLTAKFDMSWQHPVMDVFQHYTERTQGSFIERKKIALTWHYRRADPEYGAFQARECRSHLENTVTKNWDVEVMAGKANLEVRPRFVNKGEIAKRLVKAYSENGGLAPDFVLCLGDDFTDEDMFRSLRASKLPDEHVFAVTVGASSKQTLAKWHLLEPADVISAIALLNGSTDTGNVGAVAVVEGSVPEVRT